MRADLLLLGLVAAAAAAAPARADNGFVWAAPETCPGEADVRARIERRLGMPLDGSVHGIEVEIAREPAGFVARIDPRGFAIENQIRTLTSAHCDELADAVAVIVARLATEAQVRRAGGTIETRRATAIPAVGVLEPAVLREAGRWGGGLRAVAVSGIGTLPGVGVGGELAVYLRRRTYYLEAAGTRWASSPTYLTNGAPGAVDVSLQALALRVGWSPPAMFIRAWASAEVGEMTGAGIALSDSRIGSARWIAAGTGFGVAWPISVYSRLVGSIELMVPIQNARFVLADGAEIYRPSAAVARCSLGLEVGWR